MKEKSCEGCIISPDGRFRNDTIDLCRVKNCDQIPSNWIGCGSSNNIKCGNMKFVCVDGICKGCRYKEIGYCEQLCPNNCITKEKLETKLISQN